jgi:hypothetical protein
VQRARHSRQYYGQETFCDTYTRENGFVIPAFSDINSAVTEFGAIDRPRIACGVTMCAYNQSFRCRAHCVHISRPAGDSLCNCRTYRPK